MEMTENKVNKLTDVKYWFREYAKDHATQGNIRTHYIGIPTVTISLLGILDYLISIPTASGVIGGGLILLAFAVVWFFLLDKKLAALSLPVFILVYAASTQMSLTVHIILQAIGWFFQLLGHYKYEGRSPAFFKSLPQLLIGPFFIFAKAIKYKWH